MKTAQERNLLAQAEELGLEVRFHHERPVTWITVQDPDALREKAVPLAKGGQTICRLCRPTGTDDEGRTTYETIVAAAASCNPRDTFNKGIGRTIALGRAMQRLADGGYVKEQTA
jgi:hypothetical protein